MRRLLAPRRRRTRERERERELAEQLGRGRRARMEQGGEAVKATWRNAMTEKMGLVRR